VSPSRVRRDRSYSQLSRRESAVIRTVGILGIVYLAAPLVAVSIASLDPSEFFTFPPTALSLHWFRVFVTDPAWRSSTLLSLQIATLSAALAMGVGGLAGLAAGRASARVRRLLYPAMVGPLVVPAIILAIFFYRFILEVHLVGSLVSFVLANTLLTAPLVALFVMSAAMRVDRSLEYASLSCGAGPWRTLGRITIPLVAPTILVGGVFAFMWTLGDVVMSILLIAPGRTPLAVRMFSQVQTGGSQIVTAASTVLIIVPLALLATFSQLREIAARGNTPSPQMPTVVGAESTPRELTPAALES
jgi:putative spermidine/putrescine transport system permease protein